MRNFLIKFLLCCLFEGYLKKKLRWRAELLHLSLNSLALDKNKKKEHAAVSHNVWIFGPRIGLSDPKYFEKKKCLRTGALALGL